LIGGGIDDGKVVFRYRDNVRGPRVMKLDGVEFLRRFVLHVLPAGFVRIRYYGLLANRGRTERLKRCRALLAVPSDTRAAAHREGGPVTAAPAPDPFACLCCGVGRLNRVAVLVPDPFNATEASSEPMLFDTS